MATNTPAPEAARRSLTASLEGVTDGPESTVDFLWAADPEFFGFEETTSGGTYVVLAADPRRNEVVVDLGTPAVVVYDGNDRFRLDGNDRVAEPLRERARQRVGR